VDNYYTMAPNDTHYGAMKMRAFEVEEQEARSGVNKMLVAAGLVFLCTVGVFAMTMGQQTAVASNAVVNEEVTEADPGNSNTIGADCKCANPCDTALSLKDIDEPNHTMSLHYCDIIPEDVCVEGEECKKCIGIDNEYYTTIDESQACDTVDADGVRSVVLVDDPQHAGVQIGNCRAVCEYVFGRYDCWSFPCFNEGFCIDGIDGYTCECQFGYSGESCEDDIDECTLVDPENAVPREVGKEPEKVCDVNALCENSKGAYSCQCNSGWKGDGYREVGQLWYDTPSWLRRPTAEEEPNYIEACIDIDSCENNPCRNGATCLNMEGYIGQDDYDCECARGPLGEVGYVGHDCETDVDECLPEDPGHDCDPHATCVNVQGSFTCSCNEHWQSTDLNNEDRLGRMWGAEKSQAGCYDYPDCSEEPCQHGGTCTEGPDGCEELDVDQNVVMVDCYGCTCAYGWTGFDCELDENECQNSEEGDYITLPETCHDEAFCTNVPGSFECACNAGWTGDGITCIDADDCEFSPCAHGGTCYDCGTLCFTCDCVQGWRGTTCATDWNECLMGIHQCNDDATCVNNPGSYDCRCDPGFTGDGFGQGFTEEEHTYHIGAHTITETTYRGCKDIDDCDPTYYKGPELTPNGPCVMGTCEDVGPNAFVCTCVPGFTDARCDMNINECDPVLGDNDCHRFATCTDTTGSYICTCNEGFTGNGYSSCLDISDCYSQCKHGFCTDLGVDHFRCNCDDGWMNMNCDYDINECTTYTHECARRALCRNNDGSYTCECNLGYTGDGQAQGAGCKDVDDCASDPCAYGECTDEGAAAYLCACQEGFTDFNCDFDINECTGKTHDCHVDARCVNVPGDFFCRCLSGWEGDGLTCTDLDDCDPDPCDPIHGTCEDRGPNKYECVCMGGWTGIDCGMDQDECLANTHGCSPYAECANSIGSHSCVCKNTYYGDGISCTPCTVCPPGWKEEGICDKVDLECVNSDECLDITHNCHEHATCEDSEGSFKCECDQNGPGDEFWGIAINTESGCLACTECYDGFHEVQPCVSTSDRTCEINIATGLYILETEADDNLMCVAMLNGEWYPSRINFGNGDEWCGAVGDTESDKKTSLLGDGQTIFKINHIGNYNDQELKAGGDMYLIEFNDGDGYKCLFFGDEGKDIYPSLQSCHSYSLQEKENCPWVNGGKGIPFCGFTQDGMDPRDALMDNGQAVWRITPLKLNANKYILQSASKGKETLEGDKIWECLVFEEQGAATNPSRYNWGNGDTWCGAGDWGGLGKAYALLNNKQAVFILTFMQAVE